MSDALIEQLKARLAPATPGPWELCQHLKSVKDDAACRCGYRGVVYGPENDAAYAVFQPGHELPRREEEWGSEPARYDRPTEIANAQLIVEAVNALPDLLSTIEAQARRIDECASLLANVISADPGPKAAAAYQAAREWYGAYDAPPLPDNKTK